MRLTISPPTLSLLTCLILAMPNSPVIGADDAPTAEELLRHIHERDARVATRVSSTAWTDWQNGVPADWSIATALDWRFETLRFEVDSEEINDEAFAVIIEPNTSIYDVRHQVGYRALRFRRLVNPELELYALEALLERIQPQP